MSAQATTTTAPTPATTTPKVEQVHFYEVPVIDAPRAAAFYKAVFGWHCPDAGAGAPSKPGDDEAEARRQRLARRGIKSAHVFFTQEQLTGAFHVMAEPELDVAQVADGGRRNRAGPLAYFGVKSVGETVVAVEKAGGKVHIPRTEVGGGNGFFARIIDTEGNLQGIWSEV